jgi:hypothetical protein
MKEKLLWPENSSFAFSIFDDPDSQSLEATKEVYSFLRDLGFRTTKAVWPLAPTIPNADSGLTCANVEYLKLLQNLQALGFEMAYHMATSHTSDRARTQLALERFAQYFRHNPVAMANHYASDEDIYWGDARVTGWNRFLYNSFTRFRAKDKFRGHVPGDPLFWGDLCKERIKYVRNFVFGDINTLKACPFMPYHDPLRPYVNYWFSASEGSKVSYFCERIAEANQDRLEEEGGACIMYVHFGHGFWRDGCLNQRFRSLMTRLSRKQGWFVPVSTILDLLLSRKEEAILRDHERLLLERRWLLHKIRFGTA